MSQTRTILFATDFSKPAEQAFAVAHSLARDNQAKIIALHVATPPPVVTPEGVITEVNNADYVAQLKKQLQKVRSPDGSGAVEHRIEQGDPAGEILRVAQELKVDWIVMGTHGRGGLTRLLLGSVAEQVLRKAPCPVLTVRVPA